MENLKEIAASLIEKKQGRLARELYKIKAFDTRFNLMQDGHKCMYLLDVPLFDKYHEVHMEDGSKKLLTDEEAAEVLKKEREYVESIKDKAQNQLSNIKKFSRMGDVILDPEEEALKQEIAKEAPELSPFMDEEDAKKS